MKKSLLKLFEPKLITYIRKNGYQTGDFFKDALAGLSVAIVALPLAMAIAIASNLPPERGLFTAIVAGLIISLMGGSRFQIGALRYALTSNQSLCRRRCIDFYRYHYFYEEDISKDSRSDSCCHVVRISRMVFSYTY